MKLCVIGGGNLGGAIAYGAVMAQKVQSQDVHISHCKDYWKRQFEIKNCPVIFSKDNGLAIQDADIIVLAVKPWIAKEVLEEIRDKIILNHQIIVSVVARLTFQMMEEYLGVANKISLFGVIPNTAIAVKESTTFICSKNASEDQVAMIVDLFNTMGKTFLTEESQMSAYTSLSSCGIAYALKYIDAAMKGGVEMQVAEKTALAIVMQTMKGALTLLQENDSLPQTEIDKVTTPKGITMKGLEAMEKNGFSHAVIQGLKASQ